eukprot:m.225406 g.225406  ORF g.225406 m.225406 type:complete len:237 (+) comp33460_c0_seq23:190-900(+)
MLLSVKTIACAYSLKPQQAVVSAFLKIRFNSSTVLPSSSSSSLRLPIRQGKRGQPINTTLLNGIPRLNATRLSDINPQKHELRWIHKQSHSDVQQQNNKTTQPILDSREAPSKEKTNVAEFEAKDTKQKRQNLKETLAQYGASALAVHSVIYVSTLSLVIAGLHLLPSSTVAAVTDPVGDYFDIDIDIDSGLFIAGYLLTATTGPARTILTVVAAPRAAEHLSKLSYFSKYFKPPK